MSQKEMTLSRFIMEREQRNPETADLVLLLMQLGLAAKTIVREVSRAGLSTKSEEPDRLEGTVRVSSATVRLGQGAKPDAAPAKGGGKRGERG